MRSFVLILCLLATASSFADNAEQEKLFEEKIRPLLSARCYKCHGPEKQESDLRLDSRAAMLSAGATGEKAVVPGEPENSQLIKALAYEGDLQMPPDARLPAEQVALLSDWIKAGAVWPKEAVSETPLQMHERVARDRTQHWSFQVLQRPQPPRVAVAEIRTPIDALVAEKLSEHKLGFSPEADRRTLIRRASFDLLGLPPSAEEVEAFVADSAPDAFERVIDRMLASPRYGERWGRHWLDVARYADTRGYAFTSDRRYPYAYTYRDYVIRAFNADLPYDRFILEQLAADQLPLGEDKSPLAAMGFLTVGRKYNNAADDVDDLIDVTSRGLLGLTVACARCHDHKYDAVPTEDYYSLYGVFSASKQPDELPVIGKSVGGVGEEEFKQEVAKRKAEVESYVTAKRQEIMTKARDRVSDYLIRAASEKNDPAIDKMFGISLGADDLKPKIVERWRQYFKQHAKADDPTLGPWFDLMAIPAEKFTEQSKPVLEKWSTATQGLEPGQLNPALKTFLAESPPAGRAAVANLYGKLLRAAWEEWKKAGGNAEAFEKLPPEWRKPAEMIVGAGSPTDFPDGETRGYFNRAESDKVRELQKKVDSYTADSPAAPPRAMIFKENDNPGQAHVFIRGNPGRPGKPVPRQFPVVLAGPERKPFAVRSGRLELANEIISPTNPLTPRVMANRVWMHHFGEPLVNSPSDFGIRVERPLQDRLLDWLAAELRDGAWSLKNLHRQIMTSTVYRQSSLDRPDTRTIDPENRLFARMNRRRLEWEPLRDSLLAASDQLDLTIGGRSIDLFKAPYSKRRAVYGYIDRQDLPNLFRVFDLASPDQSSPRRPQTTVPQQALFMLNSPFLAERATTAADHPSVTAVDGDARIAALYRLLFARSPSAEELQLGRDFVAASAGATAGNKLNPWQQYAQLLLLTNEFAYVD